MVAEQPTGGDFVEELFLVNFAGLVVELLACARVLFPVTYITSYPSPGSGSVVAFHESPRARPAFLP